MHLGNASRARDENWANTFSPPHTLSTDGESARIVAIVWIVPSAHKRAQPKFVFDHAPCAPGGWGRLFFVTGGMPQFFRNRRRDLHDFLQKIAFRLHPTFLSSMEIEPSKFSLPFSVALCFALRALALTAKNSA